MVISAMFLVDAVDQTDVQIAGRREVAFVGKIRPLADVERVDRLRHQPVQVRISLPVRMGAHINGLLDRRWPAPAEEMPWNFAVAGRGHDAGWWRGLIEALTAAEGANSISIEHEDPFVPPERGIIEAARFLAAIMGGRA